MADNLDEINPDAVYLADEWGVSELEADRALDEQERFGGLTGQLRAEFPDSFAEARVENAPRSDFSIAFVGDVPPRIADLAVDSGLDVSLVGGAPVSERDLEALQSDVDAALYGNIGASFASSFDARRGVVSVTLPSQLQSTPDVLPAITRREDVELAFAAAPAGESDRVRGGAKLKNSNTGDYCTAGFVALDGTSGGRGVVTAGHCVSDNLNKYVHPETGNTTNIDFGTVSDDWHIGEWGDVAFYTTSDDEYSQYYHANTAFYDVTNVTGPDEFNLGETFCLYGRTSGHHCSEVFRISVTCGAGQHEVAMRTDEAQGGDSGGPWAIGVQAAGIHHGNCPYDGRTRDTFSKAGRLPAALGVHVTTN